MKISLKNKITTKYIYPFGITLGILTIIGISVLSLIQYNEWSSVYKPSLQNPIRNFIKIEPREQPVAHSVVKEAVAKEKTPEEMTTEEYICYVFGDQCKMALAVSQAENGTRQCDRFGVNTDKSIDVGVFQINSVHIKKGWKLADLVDCHKNVDYAYQIYQASGWSPWVAFQNSSYKRFLNN